jgi:hypothetical protein
MPGGVLEQCAEGNIIPKRRDIKEEWRTCNEELHNLYSAKYNYIDQVMEDEMGKEMELNGCRSLSGK